MRDNIFTIKDLSFAYGKQEVIKHMNLELHSGCITTFIGANGCGKSTLFHLLTRNLKPAGGSVIFQGKEIQSMKLREFARRAAIVHQYNTAPADLTVEKLVSYGRTPYSTFGIPENASEDEEKIRWALEITGTAVHRNKLVAELSGGQKQRVWIAMALAQGTEVLFLDEPTTYLDIRYQLDILKLVKKLNRDFGITIIMVLHDINQSLYYSDEIVAIKDGRVLAQGKPEEIITSDLIGEVYGVKLEISRIGDRMCILPV